METFLIMKRNDEERFNGDYRTKRVILEIYDAMAGAFRTDHPYQTCLDPPAADASVAVLLSPRCSPAAAKTRVSRRHG